MARVPLSIVPDTQVVSAPPDDYQRIASSPADFGGLIGQAQQRFGQETGQAGNNLTQIALEQQSRFNQITGDNAMNQFMDQGDKLTFGVPGDPTQPGLFNLKGGAALEQGPQVVDSLSKKREEIKNGLQNDAQKLQFDEQSRRYFQYKQGDISRHLSAQADVYGETVNNAAIDASANDAAHNYTDDTKIAHALSDVSAAADKNTGLKNLGPYGTPGKIDQNILDMNRRAAMGRVVQDTVMAALNAGDASRGKQILATFGGNIDPKLAEVLTARVEGKAEQADVAGSIDKIWTTPPGTPIHGGAPYGQSARPITPSGPIEPEALTRANAVRDGFIKRGLDPDTSTGFGANALHESGANPNVGPGDGGASQGMFMWNRERLARYESIYHRSPQGDTLDHQLDFVMYELNGPESDARDKIAQAQGPAAKAAAISEFYERPKDKEGEKQRRAATAQQMVLQNGGAPVTGAAQTTGATPGAPGGVSFVGDSAARGAGGVQPGATPISAPTGPGGAPTTPQRGAVAGSTRTPEAFGWEQQKLDQAEQYAAQQYPNNPRLRRELVNGVWERIQRTNMLQAKYNADVDKQRREASEQIQSNAVKAIHEDPTKFDESTIWQKDQAGNYVLTAPQQEGLIRYHETQLKEHGIEDTTQYGPAFTSASNGIFAPEGAPNKINDLSDIVKMGVPDSQGRIGLSKRGVDYLTEMWVRSRKNPDVADIDRASAHIMANTKTGMLFKGAVDSSIAMPYALRDPEGESLYNGQYAPKWLQGLSEVKKTGDPKKIWEYLTQENADKMAAGIRSEAAKAKARMNATGQVTPADVEKPGTPLPPPPVIKPSVAQPTPPAIDPLGWREALRNVPVLADEKQTPWTHQAWARALTMLAQDPTKENFDEFNAKFGIQGFDAEKLLHTMTTPTSVRTTTPYAQPEMLAPAMGVP